MAIKLWVVVTDEDGTSAEYRVEDADGDANTAARLALLVSYAYRAIDPFLCGEWDELLICLVDQAMEDGFKPIGGDDVDNAFDLLVSASKSLAKAKEEWRASP